VKFLINLDHTAVM